MNTILIILGVVLVLAVALYFGMKSGKIKDEDGDLIPDAVEDTAAEVKRRAKNVKKELKDVSDAIKEVGNQIGDVGGAAKGKPRRGRKPKKK